MLFACLISASFNEKSNLSWIDYGMLAHLYTFIICLVYIIVGQTTKLFFTTSKISGGSIKYRNYELFVKLDLLLRSCDRMMIL